MNHKLFVMLILLAAFKFSAAQNTVKLWPNGAPGNNECPQPEETFNGKMVRFVSEPTLTIYPADKTKNTGAAIVICPGGGYFIEAMDHEGYQYAEYLQSHGITGIVLKYRLPYGHHEIPMADVQHAIRTARYNAAAWAIDPGKIGVSGFSAGGHLASTAATHFDKGKPSSADPIEKVSCRPDFAVLVYPVITFDEHWGHMGSRENLIGKNHDLKLIEYFSNERQVTAETPKTFLVLADDDQTVDPKNSIEFYSALKEKGIPAELHIFREGGHGFGMTKKGKPHDQWPEMLMDWMKAEKIVK